MNFSAEFGLPFQIDNFNLQQTNNYSLVHFTLDPAARAPDPFCTIETFSQHETKEDDTFCTNKTFSEHETKEDGADQKRPKRKLREKENIREGIN